MAEVSGGRIVWNLDVDDNTFNAKLAKAGASAAATASATNGVFDALKNSLGGVAGAVGGAFSSVMGWAGNVNNALHGVVDAGAAIADKFKVVGLVAFGALGLAAKASLDMVASVQKSTLALTTYTGSAQQAASITKELIDFARSPQGVLFNRDELLSSTVLLKGAGAETSKLTQYIKDMAPAVAVSGSRFSEIAQILSKVVATGKLSAVEFDQLAERGIVLDKSLRGTAISADDLFKKLRERVPPDQLEKYAGTVDGLKIRFLSAFRELGNQLLGVQYGVNELGASFAPGSLGDKASKALIDLTNKLKSSEVKEAMKKMGDALGDFVSGAMPKLLDAFTFLAKNMDKVILLTEILVAAWATKKALDFADSIATLAARVFDLTGALGGAGKNASFLKNLSGTIVTIGFAIDTYLIIEAYNSYKELQKTLDDNKDSVKGLDDQIAKMNERIKNSKTEEERQKWILLRADLEKSKTSLADIEERYRGLGGAVNAVIDGAAGVWNHLTEKIADTTPFKVAGNAINFLTTGNLYYLGQALRLAGVDVDGIKSKFYQFSYTVTAALLSVSLTVSNFVLEVAKVGNSFGLVPDQVVADLTRLQGGVQASLVATKQAASQEALNTTTRISDLFSQLPPNVQAAINNLPPNVKGTLMNTKAGSVAEAQSLVSNTTGQIGRLPGESASAAAPTPGRLQGVLSGMKKIGQDRGGDLISGLTWALGQTNPLFAAARNIIKVLDEVIRKKAEAKSPSRLFMRIGEDLVKGITVGITQETSAAVQASSSMADQVSRAASSLATPTDFSASGLNAVTGEVDISSDIGGGGNGRTVINNITIEQSGIMTDSRQGIRRVFEEGIEAANEARRANQQPLIGGASG